MMFDVKDEYRLQMFWGLNDLLDPERMIKQEKAFYEAGVNCGFFHSRVGLATPYMSEDWLNAIHVTLEHLKQNGRFAYLYDEDRFPSGYGGGEVTKLHPEMAEKFLELVPYTEIHQEDEYAKTLARCEHNGKEYGFVLRRSKNGSLWMNGGAYIDTLDPEATKLFLSCIHEKYYSEMGEYFGETIKGVFFDEPKYSRGSSYPCVTFTEKLPERFYTEYGYSLIPELKKLFFDIEGCEKVRLDFTRLASRMFVEGFTIPYHEWCQAHGIALTGHYLFEDTLISQTECIGSAMPHYAHMDIPGIDILGSETDKEPTVLQLTSVAEQLDKPSICEVFGCIGHQRGPMQMKKLTDWMNALGVTMFCPHISLYSMRGERKRDYPPNITWMQPWFESGKGYFDHVARSSRLIRETKCLTDILVLHPVESVWARFTPLHRKVRNFSIWDEVNPYHRVNYSDEQESYEKPFFELTNKLLANGLQHHYGDECVMSQYGQVCGEGLKIGEQVYRTVLIPPTYVLEMTTVRLLKQMSDLHGKESVIFIEKYPDWVRNGEANIEEWASLVSDIDEGISVALQRNKPIISAKDIITGKTAKNVLVQTRQLDNELCAFIVNKGDYPVDIELNMPDSLHFSVLDSFTGEVFRMPSNRLRLTESGSVWLVPAEDNEKVARLLYSGASFEQNGRLIKTVYPTGRVAGDNIHVLDRVTFRCGSVIRENVPIESLWNEYYALEEGTPFELEYTFSSRDTINNVSVYVEMARNLDEILVNGQRVAVSAIAPEESVFDFNFDRIDLECVHAGTNTITLRGAKRNTIIGRELHRFLKKGERFCPNECENIYLTGNFRVEDGWLTKRNDNTVQGDITLHGYPFYAGRVEYTIDIPEDADCMHVMAKGSACREKSKSTEAIALIAPFEVDLTPFKKAKEKTITIQLENSLANVFGPLHLRDRAKLSMLGPRLFYEMGRYSKDPELIPCGIEYVSFKAWK